MKNLEEKRKEIESLCQNLDELLEVTITQNITKNINTVSVGACELSVVFNINNNEEYKDLIDRLKENQKQPELYTLDDIQKGIDIWAEHENTNYDTILDYIIKYNKPYKKQS